jgi:hypothetical protein
MDGKQVNRVIQAVLIAIVLIGVQTRDIQAKGKPAEEGQEQILAASIQINMSLKIGQAAGSSNERIVLASGLGSLIEEQGEMFIVTHNHWGELLQNFTTIEFRDAQNGLLVRMLGYEFKRLIRSQDAGTLILRAPEEIVPLRSQSATRGDADQLRSGDHVQVAFRQPGNRQRVDVLDAEVVSIGSYQGLPTVNLRSLSGQPITPGDSGGGVWLAGKLVGNSWMTIMNQVVVGGDSNVTDPVSTDRSFAALLPDVKESLDSN